MVATGSELDDDHAALDVVALFATALHAWMAGRRKRQLKMRLLLVPAPLFFFALPDLLDDERREHP
ncbi:MAG: hypothetical protein U0270_40055 [Labilithrix sp.]